MANAHLDDEAQIRQGIERAKFVQKGMKHPSSPPLLLLNSGDTSPNLGTTSRNRSIVSRSKKKSLSFAHIQSLSFYPFFRNKPTACPPRFEMLKTRSTVLRRNKIANLPETKKKEMGEILGKYVQKNWPAWHLFPGTWTMIGTCPSGSQRTTALLTFVLAGCVGTTSRDIEP